MTNLLSLALALPTGHPAGHPAGHLVDDATDPMDDPRGAAWIDTTESLLAAFAARTGEEPSSWCRFVVRSAAEHVWVESDGAPCWELFEPESYFPRMPFVPGDGGVETAAVTLIAFVTWLAQEGHLTVGAAFSLLRRLQRHIMPDVVELGCLPPHAYVKAASC